MVLAMPESNINGRNREPFAISRTVAQRGRAGLLSILIITIGLTSWSQVSAVQVPGPNPVRVAAFTLDRERGQQRTSLISPSVDQIKALISQLDSLNYVERESAANELADIGGLAIGPLALQSLDCSPEQSWRIKKTLEKICTGGDEEVFFRAFGILQLRFDGGNVAMSRKMTELQNKWKLKRKQEAIAKLRSKGAIVNDPWENTPQDQNLQLGGFGGNMIFLNGRPVEMFDDDISPVTTRPKPKPALSEKELRNRIDQILNSDLEETREIVLSNADTPDRVDSFVDPFDNPIIVNQGVFARAGFPRSATSGVTVSLTKDWNGEDQDLESLTAVSQLSEISVIDVKLSSDALHTITRCPTLSKLILSGRSPSLKEIAGLSWPESLREFEFANRMITSELIEACASINTLQKLSFDQCEMQDAVFDELKTLSQLRGLEFKTTVINQSMFRSIADLKSLTSLNLSACKFQTRDFESLKSQRPELQVSFTAQAFLGVRGPVEVIRLAGADEVGPAGCLISEVISGSGADKAGMKIGDVIQSVNRQPIFRFEDLRLHIAQHVPGEKLDVVVQRGEESIDLVVELGDIKSVPEN